MENKDLPPKNNEEAPGIFRRLVDTLVGIGLGESILRTGTTVLSIALLVVVVWLLRIFYAQRGADSGSPSANAVEAMPTLPVEGGGNIQTVSVAIFDGIP